MVLPIALLLSFQLVGEVLTRALGLTVPGPVLGMAMLLIALATVPGLGEMIRPVAVGLLSHLSLLFVPAGVGVIGHLEIFGEHGVAILLAIVVSTALAIAVGALVFARVARLVGVADD